MSVGAVPSTAVITWISGPVLRARASGPFALREAVRVGPQALLGEVVRLAEDEIVVQVYEDTTGLRPGVEVVGVGAPLAIRLGPGLLGNIFDGLLRPLSNTTMARLPGFCTPMVARLPSPISISPSPVMTATRAAGLASARPSPIIAAPPMAPQR